MLIKLILVIISSFLLVNESFNVLDRFKKKRKRIILIITLLLLFAFSFVDAIETVREGDELIKKANTIIMKSDTLTANTRIIEVDLKKNIESVKEAGKSLAQIDSILKDVKDSISDQVDVLKGAVEKSKELVRLEEMKFNQEQADLRFYTKNVYLIRSQKDTTKLTFGYVLQNKGVRAAEDLKSYTGMFYYKSSSDKLSEVNMRKLNDNVVPYRLGKGDFIKQEFTLTHQKSLDNLDQLLLVLGVDYIDEISIKKLKKRAYYTGTKLNNDTINFKLLNDRFLLHTLNYKLKQLNLDEYAFEF